MTSSESAVIFAILFLLPATPFIVVAYPPVGTTNLRFTDASLPRSHLFDASGRTIGETV
jgi:hypothetical protein